MRYRNVFCKTRVVQSVVEQRKGCTLYKRNEKNLAKGVKMCSLETRTLQCV